MVSRVNGLVILRKQGVGHNGSSEWGWMQERKDANRGVGSVSRKQKLTLIHEPALTCELESDRQYTATIGLHKAPPALLQHQHAQHDQTLSLAAIPCCVYGRPA